MVDYKMMQKDVLCLQETWLYPEQNDNHSIADYDACFASAGKGKGVATFSKIAFENKVISIDPDGTFQLLKTVVKGITIISVYISSNCSKLESVVAFLEEHKTESSLIIGDFNFSPDYSNQITKQLKSWNFCQMIRSPQLCSEAQRVHKEKWSLVRFFLTILRK